MEHIELMGAFFRWLPGLLLQALFQNVLYNTIAVAVKIGGPITGFLQTLLTYFLGQGQNTQASLIALLRMRLPFQYLADQELGTRESILPLQFSPLPLPPPPVPI